jgi:hypothetical protein
LTEDPGAVKGCRFIANIESSADYKTAAAYGELRKKAADHGASTVLMVVPPRGSEHGHVAGEAYSCASGWAWKRVEPVAMPDSFVSTAIRSVDSLLASELVYDGVTDRRR